MQFLCSDNAVVKYFVRIGLWCVYVLFLLFFFCHFYCFYYFTCVLWTFLSEINLIDWLIDKWVSEVWVRMLIADASIAVTTRGDRRGDDRHNQLPIIVNTRGDSRYIRCSNLKHV